MAKDYTWVWIAMLIGVIVVGGQQGWFSRTTYIDNSEIINQLENPNNLPGVQCSLKLDKSVINSGDQITGTISDGKNVFCEVYGKYDGVWQKVFDGTTNLNGQLIESDYLTLVGDYLFVAICDDCTTNSVSLTVNPVGDTCTDSDGGQDKFTPGHVTIGEDSIYDVCEADNSGVIEYYCQDNALAGVSLICDAGQTCVSTRSGGYCDDAGAGGWLPGQEVYAESGEGGISGGVVPATGYINLEDYGFIPGTACSLKVRLHTYWDYNNEAACQGMVAQQGLIWSFHDSDSNPWSRIDYSPPSNIYDVIYPPLDWDGVNPWILKVGMLYQIPECSISYHYDLNIDIHECD